MAVSSLCASCMNLVIAVVSMIQAINWARDGERKSVYKNRIERYEIDEGCRLMMGWSNGSLLEVVKEVHSTFVEALCGTTKLAVHIV